MTALIKTVFRIFGGSLLAVLCWSAAAAGCQDTASAPVVLGADQRVPPAPDSLLHHRFTDVSGKLTLAEIVARDRAGEFALRCSASAAVPVGGALWVRIDVRIADGAPREWFLNAGPFEIDELQVHRLRDGVSPLTTYSGRAVEPSGRSISSRWPSASLTFPDFGPMRLYVRITGASGPEISLKFLQKTAFETQNRIDLAVLAAFFGFMAAMLVVNTLLYVRGGQIQSVYYCLYLLFISGHVFFYSGPAHLLSPVPIYGTLADGISQTFAIFAALFLLFCGRALLQLPAKMPAADKTILGLGLAMVVTLVLEIAGFLPYAIPSGIPTALAGLIMAGCAAVQAFRGVRSARFFFASFVAILIVFLIDYLAFAFSDAVSALPSYVESAEHWIFEIAIVVESILIAFALSYFIRDMKGEVASVREELAVTARKAGVRAKVETANSRARPQISSDEAFFEKTLSVIQDNLENEAFGVKQLADKLAVSPRSLRRRIQASTGVAPVEFLRQERLERARRYLATGSYNSVTEVAQAVGIPNTSYFTRTFRERYGCTPWSILVSPDEGEG